MKITTKQTRRNMFIPDGLWEEAVQLAASKDISAADVVRTALQKYLEAVKRAKLAAQEAANGR